MVGKTLLIAGLVLAALIIAYFVAAYWPARVWLTITHKEEPFQFRVEKNFNVNYITTIAFWREGEDDYLWILNVSSSPVTSVSYGVRPDRFKQDCPRGNATPRPIMPGDVFYVSVAYQYDRPYMPCAGGETFRFAVTDGGVLEPLGLPQTWSAPKNHPEPKTVLDALGEQSDDSIDAQQ